MNPGVAAWYESVEDSELYVSVLLLGELRKGVERARSRDPIKALALEHWLAGFDRAFGDQVLPINAAVADVWGRFSANRPISTVDGLLAETTVVRDLALVTRNVADVAHTGVKLLNPFSAE